MRPPTLHPQDKRLLFTRLASIFVLCTSISLAFALSLIAIRPPIPAQHSSLQYTQPIKTKSSATPAQVTHTPVASPTASTGSTSSIEMRAKSLPHVPLIYHGNPKLPEVALTFDDGPNPPYTQQVLAILQRYNIKATFFCIGRQVHAYPVSIKQEYTAGHVVGDHTWSHPYLPALSGASISQQLSSTADEITRTIGVRPSFFRPPYGAFSTQVLTYAHAQGLSTVMWNADPQDWSMPGTNLIIARVLAQVHNGSIVLMHDGGGNRSQTVAALPTIITRLEQRGYHFVTLPQLVDDLTK